MADTISKIENYTVSLPDRPGEGAKVLAALREGGADLTAVWGYPLGPGDARLELLPKSGSALRKAAKKAGLTLSGKRTAFLVQGKDKPGVVAAHLAKLGAAGINVHAVQAVCAGSGRYGAVIFVAPGDLAKAAKALR